jgi:ubiquinone/menaquinone biosynthesis C-methylase UbiE
MAEPQIRFEDGAAYERMMGAWSRLAGVSFLEWLAPRPGLRWIDIGCGNGAFTQLLIERCAPAEVHGIDPSEGQLAFARARPQARMAQFHQGDAMALPSPDHRFDAAVMALVIFFVPDPVKGVAEMTRVVRPGGTVAAYVWDILEAGAPHEPIHAELRHMGKRPMLPPSAPASRMATLRELWSGAGITDVEMHQVTVQRAFADFDEFWTINATAPSLGPTIAALSSEDAALLISRVRARLPADTAGRITCEARANFVKGRVPG